jgi:hypothetical protein
VETNERCSPAPWSLLAGRMKDKSTLPLDPPLYPAAGSLGTLLVWMTGYKRQCSPIDSATTSGNLPKDNARLRPIPQLWSNFATTNSAREQHHARRYDLAPLRPWLGPAAKPNRSAKIEPLVCNHQWPLVSGVAILPRTFATSWYKSDDEGERGEKEAYQTLPSAGNLPSTGLASLEGGPLRHAHKRGEVEREETDRGSSGFCSCRGGGWNCQT